MLQSGVGERQKQLWYTTQNLIKEYLCPGFSFFVDFDYPVQYPNATHQN